MNRFQPLLLSVLGGILLWASWPVSPFTFLIFIAFLPFLWFEDRCTNRMQFLYWTYLCLLTWNLLTTWWICNSTVPGGIAAILANSLLMCIPLLGFYNIKRTLGRKAGYISLVVFWLTFEYIHLNWQLSWPWLTLGNVFASSPGWVQWYEYTGTSGGTLWILLVNILVYLAFLADKSRPVQINKQLALISALVLFTPFILSFLVKPAVIPAVEGTPEIIVIQPNIDPYEKFEQGSQEKQVNLLISLSEKQIDSNTAVVVWPETALNYASGIDEGTLKTNHFLLPVRAFLGRHPQVKLLTGIEGYGIFTEQGKTSLSRQIPGSGLYYESYNSAALMDSTGEALLYHKSKLVPGVETLPPFLRFISSWFEQFGGTSTGYAPQEARTVLSDERSGLRFAPAICYESIYGEFLTEYIRNGANVIGIITNDGWWANTSGHKQHLVYARLRAIETRRWVVRSANTGISCFITPLGQVLDAQPWDTMAGIKRKVVPASRLTFYVRFGDIISKTAAGMAMLIVLASIIFRLRYSFNQNKIK